VDVLHFAIDGEHPKHAAIAAAFVQFHSRLVISKVLGQPLHSFPLLGTEMHFTDPGAFQFLLGELFIDGSYGGHHETPATILDCGSNIGMSILYFKSLWPDAKIVGVEASPETFALLQQNVKTLSDVSVLNAAVCDRHGTMAFYPSSPNSMTGSFNAIRSGGESVLVETIPMSDLVTGPIDLMKMDIEGAETAAFTELESSGKMHLIREMLIEYHFHLPGETDTLTQFLDRLTRCGFDFELGANMPQVFGECHDMFIWAKRIPN
jgi:FkbM family methyltransferase